MTTPERLDDAVALRVIESSAVVGAVQRSVDMVGAASRSSQAVTLTRQAYDEWMQATAGARRTALGTMLVVAGAVYVATTLAAAPPPGWLWLIVPWLTIAVGALGLVSGVLQRAPSE